MTKKIKTADIVCPTCEKTKTWREDNSFRPFCSERCKLIDLGEWASEERKIAGDPISPEDASDDESKE